MINSMYFEIRDTLGYISPTDSDINDTDYKISQMSDPSYITNFYIHISPNKRKGL